MSIDKDFFDVVRAAQHEGEPVAVYRKGILGQVCVRVIDVFSRAPVDVILKGDPNDASVDENDLRVVFWTEMEHAFFRRANKDMIEKGYMVPVDLKAPIKPTVNEITDDELREILGKPFFSLKALLVKLTSPHPVTRLLHMAEDMNKPVGTITRIKERLSELQKTED